MNEQRIGFGLDLHRFTGVGEAERPLLLGGVELAGERGLVGHSDSDALAHAVADAILGAASLGALGMHFPATDPGFAGADSLGILRHSAGLAAAREWQLVNAACTVLGERPKVSPHREEMMRLLSEAAGGPVHVKATRPERMGALGRVEGLACFAVVLLGR